MLAFIALGNLFTKDIERIGSFLKNIPRLYSAPTFVVLYVLSNFFIFADVKDLLKPIGAIIFGVVFSTALIYLAEIINAYIFFNGSSILGRKYIEKSLRGKFKNFYEKLGNINLGWVFLLRLMPLVPYRVLDISCGLSKVSFKKYMLAVLLASPPRIFWIQAVLASVGGFSVEKIVKYYQDNPQITLFIFLYFVISLIFAFTLRKKFK
jgi:uncharacterized membrane protein YdjX (TVP38/TMEM64 family)